MQEVRQWTVGGGGGKGSQGGSSTFDSITSAGGGTALHLLDLQVDLEA